MANYSTVVKAIQEELGCSWKEAKKVYADRKSAGTLNSDGASGTTLTAEKPAEAPAPSEIQKRANDLERLLNRKEFNFAKMERYAKEYLGNNAVLHRNKYNPREGYITCGSIRVPKVGIMRIKS